MSTKTITRTDRWGTPDPLESYEMVDRTEDSDPELISQGVRPSPSWQSSAALGHDYDATGPGRRSLNAGDRRAGEPVPRTELEEMAKRMEDIREYRESVGGSRSEKRERHTTPRLSPMC